MVFGNGVLFTYETAGTNNHDQHVEGKNKPVCRADAVEDPKSRGKLDCDGIVVGQRGCVSPHETVEQLSSAKVSEKDDEDELEG